MTCTRIDLIRHGEPEGGNVFRGRIDPALTSQGRWQFEQRLQLIEPGWTRVISSPLSRCRVSAEVLAARLGLPLEIDPRWIEIDYGEWEDCLISDILREHADEARRLWKDPLNFRAPGGESVLEMQARVIEGWQSLLSRYEGEHLLVVAHGGVMRVLAQHLLQLAPDAMSRLAIPFAGLMRYRVDRSEWQGKTEYWTSMEGMDGAELLQPDA